MEETAKGCKDPIVQITIKLSRMFGANRQDDANNPFSTYCAWRSSC